jgi:hypothetical protein
MSAAALLLAGSVAVLAFEASAAESVDASRPLRCVPTEIAECDLAAQCDRVSFEEAEIPPTIRVDFAAKQIVSADGARTSPIRTVEVEETVLIVQGSQNGRGWSLVVDRPTGHMSASVSEAEGSFVLAGTCAAE